jgi:hypothetical protein
LKENIKPLLVETFGEMIGLNGIKGVEEASDRTVTASGTMFCGRVDPFLMTFTCLLVGLIPLATFVSDISREATVDEITTLDRKVSVPA